MSTNNNFFPNSEADRKSMGSLIATLAGSTSGVLLLILFIVSLIVVISVVMHLKRRQKAENGCSHDQPSSVLYDTIEETQITNARCYNQGSSPAVLSTKEVSHEEPDVSTMIENVASSPVDLEARQPYEEGLSLEQNIAYYEPIKVVLSSNVAYGSHDHVYQGAESQDENEYSYI